MNPPSEGPVKQETPRTIPTLLTIAGSDPSGGAGIQADLKTFSALGAYGCAVLTALTAQSTRGVTGVHPVPADFVSEQITTLVDDVALDATKIGMLGDRRVTQAVAEAVRSGRLGLVVLDPVMVSTAGSRLLDDDALQDLRALAGQVDLITPNLPEAAVLLEQDEATDLGQMHRQARDLRERFGVPRVLLKGGHLPGAQSGMDIAVDVWADVEGTSEIHGPWVRTPHTHGTGCTLAAAIAALLAHHGEDYLAAVRAAKGWLTGALAHGEDLQIGAGPGPVHHFYDLWR